MKKVLFASTALVAFAGAASAQQSDAITLTGNAEMGILSSERLSFDRGADNGFVTEDKVGFHTDIDVTFTLSGETDGGLLFGANIDLDESGNGEPFENPRTQGGESIFLSGRFGTLTAGDTDGAVDWAMTEVAFNSGSLGDDETLHGGFNANSGLDGLYDGQILRYDYSIGDFGIAVSAEIDDTDGEGNDDVFGVGARYQLDLGGSEISLGAGYQSAALADVDVDTYGVSVNGTIAGFAVGLNYMNFENHVPGAAIADGNFGGFLDDLNDALPEAAQELVVNGRLLTPGDDSDHIGVGVGYVISGVLLSANYGKYESDAGGSIDGYGLTAGYDLGGGALLQAGYGHSDYSDLGIDGLDDANTFSLGVRMNF